MFMPPFSSAQFERVLFQPKPVPGAVIRLRISGPADQLFALAFHVAYIYEKASVVFTAVEELCIAIPYFDGLRNSLRSDIETCNSGVDRLRFVTE